jgi:hypothetical protein
MRDWLNAIFTFIGTSSLTDEEYAGINFVDMVALTYNQAAYDQLALVLEAREAVSDLQQRLVGIFNAKGVDVKAHSTAKTNIYLGDAL